MQANQDDEPQVHNRVLAILQAVTQIRQSSLEVRRAFAAATPQNGARVFRYQPAYGRTRA